MMMRMSSLSSSSSSSSSRRLLLQNNNNNNNNNNNKNKIQYLFWKPTTYQYLMYYYYVICVCVCFVTGVTSISTSTSASSSSAITRTRATRRTLKEQRLSDIETYERNVLIQFYQESIGMIQTSIITTNTNDPESEENDEFFLNDWTHADGWIQYRTSNITELWDKTNVYWLQRDDDNNGDDTNNTTNNRLIHVCEWYGIECQIKQMNDTYIQQNIIGLNLNRNGIMINVFPTILYTLPYLEYINVRGNYIRSCGFPIENTATLPLTYIAPLRYIDYSDCQLESINGISTFHTTLKEVHLARNPQFNNIASSTVGGNSNNGGLFPMELFQLTNLLSLSLSMNNIYDTIPSSLSQLSLLTNLDLNYNSIYGTLSSATFEKLPNLQFLNLGENLLSGSISTTSISTSTTNDGIIPCRNLSILNLQGRNKNQQQGEQNEMFYDGLESLQQTQEVSLSSSSSMNIGFNGTLPSFANCTKLHTLLLGNNQFTGTIPTHFLQYSQIGQEGIIPIIETTNPSPRTTTGGGGTTINNNNYNHAVQTLTVNLINNQLSGTIPIELSRFDYFTFELVGTKNLFSGPLPDIFCSRDKWMHGLVSRFGCNAILCDIHTYNSIGQQVSTNEPCHICDTTTTTTSNDDDSYLGSTTCSNDNISDTGGVVAGADSGGGGGTVIIADTGATDGTSGSLPFTTTTTPPPTKSQVRILAELYLALDGPTRWFTKDGWENYDWYFDSSNSGGGHTLDQMDTIEGSGALSYIDICTMYGIHCNEQTGLVDTITLSNNNLMGIVPTSIFQLPGLVSLDLSYNRIRFATTSNDMDGSSSSSSNEIRENDDDNDESVMGLHAIRFATKLTKLRLTNTEIRSFDGIHGAVNTLTELYLDLCDLETSLPMELFQLTNLRTLHLENSYITGIIPTEIGKLSKLTRLNLNENSLRGAIPREIGDLRDLENLDLSDNQLEGILPEEIGDLSRLFSLRINSGRGGLGGPLPSFELLTRIEDLELAFNAFEGTIPSNFLSGRTSTSHLKIRLTGNSLTGPVPMTLEKFPNLFLELEDNMITDLPDALCQKPEWMDEEVGKVANPCDAILCPIGTYSPHGRAISRDNVACLECSANQYYGETVCETAGLQSNREVEILDLIYASTGGQNWNATHTNWTKKGVPICYREGILCGYKVKNNSPDVDMNSEVTEIILDNFGLRGRLPSEIYELTKLRRLSVARNPVDVSFIGIEQAKILEVINLGFTDVQSFRGIENGGPFITDLHFSGSGVAGTFPTELLNLTSLQKLFLEDNRMTGRIPTEIANLKKLHKLSLKLNDFTGPLPIEIGLLSSLDTLDVGNNKLSGTIPTELGKLTNLTSLNLAAQESFHKLSGPLFPFDTNPKLISLNISRNGFVGTVPSRLLASVTQTAHIFVDLSHNNLNGTLPTELGLFSYLNIDLTANMISSIPEEICTHPGWMGGVVGIVSTEDRCDAILCKPGTMNTKGRQMHRDEKCQPCSSIDEAPFFGSTACENMVVKREREILIQFSDAMDGRNWTYKENWLSDLSVCTWYGIDCDGNDFVTGIRLDRNGLKQTIDSFDLLGHLSGLKNLKVLMLDNCIAEIDFNRIEEATLLETISLSNANLQSLQGINRARYLKRLSAADNNITGTFPEDILQLSSLVELYLPGNYLEGKIPVELYTLTSLEHILLQENQLAGTLGTEFGKLTVLRELVMGNNYFSGSIPSEISSLSTLERISFRAQRGGQFNGSLPDFAGAGQLWFIDLSHNSITGIIPDTLLSGSLNTNRVIEIILDGNKISGSLPTSLAKFPRLDIRLSDNMIEAIPPELCDNQGWMKSMVGRFEGSKCNAILCPKGFYNELGRQAFEDRPCEPCNIPEATKFMGSTSCSLFSERGILKRVYTETGGQDWKINNRWLTDAPICSWYGILCEDPTSDKGVRALDLSGNGLTGTFPFELWQFPLIKEVFLKDNPDLFISFRELTQNSQALEKLELVGSRVENLDGLSNIKNLKNISVSGLNGPFPDDIFNLKGLQYLDLSHSFIVGTLPKRIGELTHLTQLKASWNDFHGQLPTELAYLSNLEVFEFDENLLSGRLPSTQISALLHLERFSISRVSKSGRKVTGDIPKFDKVLKLSYLRLNGNELSGSIPSEFLSSTFTIEQIDLRNNSLSGKLPETLLSKQNADIFVPENLESDWIPVRDPLLDQKEILVDIYNSCGGDFWIRNDFWNTNVDICSWYGVGCNRGKVILLNLHNNNVTGLFPPRGFLLPKLEVLRLSSNPIMMTFANIRDAQNLRELKIDNTNLVTLANLGDANMLTVLDIGASNVTDKKFPYEILKLQNLRILLMAGNDFIGTLPDSLSQLPYLRIVDLSNNLFSGSLPAWEDSFTLSQIQLNDNNFSGQIPSSFVKDVPRLNLMNISLQNNKLSGSLPFEFERFDKLYIDVHNNNIIALPGNLCKKSEWNDGSVGKFGCDGILCPPGTNNPTGRMTHESPTCKRCRNKHDLYGQSECVTSRANRYLSLFVPVMTVVSMALMHAYDSIVS